MLVWIIFNFKSVNFFYIVNTSCQGSKMADFKITI